MAFLPPWRRILIPFLAAALLAPGAGCSRGSPPGGPAQTPKALGEEELALVRERMARLGGPVTVTVFEGEAGVEAKGKERRRWETARLLDAMREASPLLEVKRTSVGQGAAGETVRPVPEAAHGPRMRVETEGGKGFLYLGYPAQHELGIFLDATLLFSGAAGQAPAFSPTTDRFLAALDRDLRLEIFVTPH